MLNFYENLVLSGCKNGVDGNPSTQFLHPENNNRWGLSIGLKIYLNEIYIGGASSAKLPQEKWISGPLYLEHPVACTHEWGHPHDRNRWSLNKRKPNKSHQYYISSNSSDRKPFFFATLIGIRKYHFKHMLKNRQFSAFSSGNVCRVMTHHSLSLSCINS